MKYLITEYIKKMNVDDIINYAKNNNINLTYHDAIILYTYAKNNYEDFLSGNDTLLIKEIKEKITQETFKEIYKIYLEYKIKYLK